MKLFVNDLDATLNIGGTVYTDYLADIDDSDGQVIAISTSEKCWAYQEGDDCWVDVDNPAQSVEIKKVPTIGDLLRQEWNR